MLISGGADKILVLDTFLHECIESWDFI